MDKYRQTHILRDRILYTVMMLAIFIPLRKLPLVGVIQNEGVESIEEGINLLEYALTGDSGTLTIMSLGFTAYFLTNIALQIVFACLSKKVKNNIPSDLMGKLVIVIATVAATFQAVSKVSSLSYGDTADDILLLRTVNILQLVAGFAIMIWFGNQIKKHGIGGLTVLMLFNIVSGFTKTIKNNLDQNWSLAIVLCLAALLVTIFMETHEKRIPVQRIGVQSIHADKSYLAIKFNPVGTLPVMFSTSVLMLVRFLTDILAKEPFNITTLDGVSEKITFTQPLGVMVYIGVIYALTIFFAFIFVSPKDISENFLKSGDCIVNIRAGANTRIYLLGYVLLLSIFSATAFSLCLGIPLYLSLIGILYPPFAMVPMSFMLAVVMVSKMIQEMIMYFNYDRYKPFV